MNTEPILHVVFFRTGSGREPVREWLLELEKEDRKIIGEDIKLLQFRWPLGMPLVKKLEADLWEVRSHLAGDALRVFASQLKAMRCHFYMDSLRKARKYHYRI